jgi:membrane-associated phospholipid phosphatase
MLNTVADRLHGSWATAISNILSPPAVWAMIAYPIALHETKSATEALLLAALYAGLVSLVPVLFVAYLLHSGRVSDLHLKDRGDRYLPYAVTIVVSAIAWILMVALGAPYILKLLAIVSLVSVVIMAIITLFWQISMHTMSISAAVVALGMVFGPPAALLASPLIPLVGWARLSLKRHTVAQIIGGALVGLLIPLLMAALFGPASL